MKLSDSDRATLAAITAAIEEEDPEFCQRLRQGPDVELPASESKRSRFMRSIVRPWSWGLMAVLIPLAVTLVVLGLPGQRASLIVAGAAVGLLDLMWGALWWRARRHSSS